MSRKTIFIFSIIIGLLVFAIGQWQIGRFSRHQENLLLEQANRQQQELSQLIISRHSDPRDLVRLGRRLAERNSMVTVAILEKATELDKNYRDAWAYLGYANLQMGSFQQAVAATEKALALEPINPQIRQLLILAYQKNGQADRAVTLENTTKELRD